MIAELIAVGGGVALWLTRRKTPRVSGTRYLHPAERLALYRDRLDNHEGLLSERHEVRLAKSERPAFEIWRMAKRSHPTFADLLHREALRDPRAQVPKPLPRVASIAGRKRK